MSSRVNRRQVLTVSLGAAAAAALASAGALPAAAAGHTGGELPPVEGMSGDRRANELWYRMDDATLYNSAQEVKDAYTALNAYLGNLESGLREKWFTLVTSPDYPRNLVEFVTPIKPQLEVLSRTQLGVFDTYYGGRHDRLGQAYGWFGEGVLYDPRGHAPYLVHTMNTVNNQPPPGYHTWYVYLRAMMVLGISARRWERIAPLVSFGWAMQSTARPVQDAVNPPLPRRTVRRLAATWLTKDIRQLDRDFQSFPLPAGMS